MTAFFRHALELLSVACLVSLVFAGDGGAPSAPPKARVDVVEETINGQKIEDPYRWLEDGSNPETQQFMKDQLAYTHSLLDAKPQHQKIHDRLTQLLNMGSL